MTDSDYTILPVQGVFSRSSGRLVGVIPEGSSDVSFTGTADTADGVGVLSAPEVLGVRGSVSHGSPSAVAKLKRAAWTLNPFSVSSDAPTIGTPVVNTTTNATQGSAISGGVTYLAQDVIAGTSKAFTLFNGSLFKLIATSTDGVKFYSGVNQTGASIPTLEVGFYTDATSLELCDRNAGFWQIFVDGAPASSTLTTIPSASGFALARLPLTFSTRKRRKIVCVGISTGFWGVAVDSGATIEALDLSSEITMGAMTDSYGDIKSPILTAGPMGYAAAKLNIWGFSNSTSGGTGYDAVNGSYQNFLTRLGPWLSQGFTPDVLLTYGSVNDSANPANPSAYYAAARAYLPASLIICIGPQTPNATQIASGPARQAAISAAAKSIVGPTIVIDPVAGSWWAKDRLGSISTGSAGGGMWMNTVSNATYYGDGTHYNSAGAAYLGECFASAIRSAVMTMSD